MPLPQNPFDGQTFRNLVWDAASGTWRKSGKYQDLGDVSFLGSILQIRTYTGAGEHTWTKPIDVPENSIVAFRGVGGGGSGSVARASSRGAGRGVIGASGGGGGEYGQFYFKLSDLGDTETVVVGGGGGGRSVGTGGSGGSSGDRRNGRDGGDTTFAGTSIKGGRGGRSQINVDTLSGGRVSVGISTLTHGSRGSFSSFPHSGTTGTTGGGACGGSYFRRDGSGQWTTVTNVSVRADGAQSGNWAAGAGRGAGSVFPSGGSRENSSRRGGASSNRHGNGGSGIGSTSKSGRRTSGGGGRPGGGSGGSSIWRRTGQSSYGARSSSGARGWAQIIVISPSSTFEEVAQ